MSEGIHCISEMSRECLAEKVEALPTKKRQAKKQGSPSIGWQNPHSTTRNQFTGQ